jgi:hypothetical protein
MVISKMLGMLVPKLLGMLLSKSLGMLVPKMLGTLVYWLWEVRLPAVRGAGCDDRGGVPVSGCAQCWSRGAGGVRVLAVRGAGLAVAWSAGWGCARC